VNTIDAIALKQLYASHYFQSALDLTVCIKDSARPREPGFYLITVKGSQQAALTASKAELCERWLSAKPARRWRHADRDQAEVGSGAR
jgi:hypothetical protein